MYGIIACGSRIRRIISRLPSERTRLFRRRWQKLGGWPRHLPVHAPERFHGSPVTPSTPAKRGCSSKRRACTGAARTTALPACFATLRGPRGCRGCTGGLGPQCGAASRRRVCIFLSTRDAKQRRRDAAPCRRRPAAARRPSTFFRALPPRR